MLKNSELGQSPHHLHASRVTSAKRPYLRKHLMIFRQNWPSVLYKIRMNKGLAVSPTRSCTCLSLGRRIHTTACPPCSRPLRLDCPEQLVRSKPGRWSNVPRIGLPGLIYQLKSAEGKGRINFVFYTKDHYPAPTPNDDAGDLSNVTRDNWKGIVTDLESHKTGSAGDWSAYRRTILHERSHWNTEWQGSVKPQVVEAENDIEKVGVGFDAAADAAKAEKILEPQAKKIFNDATAEARKTYDH